MVNDLFGKGLLGGRAVIRAVRLIRVAFDKCAKAQVPRVMRDVDTSSIEHIVIMDNDLLDHGRCALFLGVWHNDVG